MDVKEYKIKQLNKKYFQKSTFFLYPLLKIPKTVVPIVTYIQWDNYFSLEDKVIICKFDKFSTESEKKTEIEHLIKHPLYLDYYELEDDTLVYVFSIKSFDKVIELFLKGEYSKFPESIKERIISFYKPESVTRSYMKSYLYPEFFYEVYSELLDVPIDLLKSTKELATPPNLEKESMKIKVKNITILG